MMDNARKNKEILRFPRLDTILMVEEFIRENSGKFNKRGIWKGIPKKMMYQTFCVIIDYLLHSRKIIVDSEGKIIWIGQNEKFLKEKVRK